MADASGALTTVLLHVDADVGLGEADGVEVVVLEEGEVVDRARAHLVERVGVALEAPEPQEDVQFRRVAVRARAVPQDVRQVDVDGLGVS